PQTAELQQRLNDLKARKAQSEARANDLRRQANEHEARAAELDRQRAIAKEPRKSEIGAEWRREKQAASDAHKDADRAFQDAVEAQLEAQKTAARLNTDARSKLPCFAAGTPVWTPTGPRSIDGLEVGDLVLAHDPEGFATVRRRVLEVFKNRTMRFFR